MLLLNDNDIGVVVNTHAFFFYTHVWGVLIIAATTTRTTTITKKHSHVV